MFLTIGTETIVLPGIDSRPKGLADSHLNVDRCAPAYWIAAIAEFKIDTQASI